jgi:uncharacterized membrane protein YfcA
VELDWLLVAVAVVVGMLVGLTGVGAGAIMTPLLVGFFGVSLPVAISTDLVFATVTKLAAVPFHHRNGTINWKLLGRLWSGSIPGTVVGVAIVVLVAAGEQTTWLTWPLVGVVLLTAITIAKRAINGRKNALVKRRELHPLVAPVGGFAIGNAVALTSVGAGALGMALLVRLFPPSAKPGELVGTDLAHAVPIAFIAGTAYGLTGLLSLSLLLTLLLGSIPGVIAGSFFSGRLPPRILNASLAVILIAAAIFVVVKNLS